MTHKKPEFRLDDNLRFVPKDPNSLQVYVDQLQTGLEHETDPIKRVRLLGEIAVYSRQLDQFETAEKFLQEALEIIKAQRLGIKMEVQQKIRLAHVWQEKKEFDKSDRLFAEMIQICRENSEANIYLDFALQHAGKNEFDQSRFQQALDCFYEALQLRLKKNSPTDQIDSTRAAILRTQELMGIIDSKTRRVYTEKAMQYSRDWLSQPDPSDMYELLKKVFIPQGVTADIGCGNGRDAYWLAKNGYQVKGFDSSFELIKIATSLYPNIVFQQSFLPTLHEIEDSFDNILCETVVMHVPRNHIPMAIHNLKRILKPEGILYLSWRVTEKEDLRHADGRLYSAFDSKFIIDQFPKNSIAHFEDKISVSSSKRVCRLVFKKDQS